MTFRERFGFWVTVGAMGAAAQYATHDHDKYPLSIALWAFGIWTLGAFIYAGIRHLLARKKGGQVAGQ